MIESVEKVLSFIEQEAMVRPSWNVLAAVSGGADSVCLLRLLLLLKDRLNIQVGAVHVNHGIRTMADRDEAFVRELCRSLEVPLTVYQVHVPEEAKRTGQGLEETARRLRYEAFEACEADAIALAHHRRDQAETLIMNLVRGSGLKGMCGIPPVRGRFIRPLLPLSPEEIRAFLREIGQPWVEDETNADISYRRNFIRHEGLRYLEEHFNPAVEETLARTAALLQKDEAMLELLTEEHYEHCLSGSQLSVSRLLLEPEALRGRLLRRFLEQNAQLVNMAETHVNALEKLLYAQSGKSVDLPGNLTVTRSFDHLILEKKGQKEREYEVFPIENIPFHGRFDRFGIELEVSFVENVKNDSFSKNLYTKSFDYDTIKNTLILRTRRAGDYLSIGSGHKKLKEYMIETGIPRHERDSVPLLADGSHILWVIGGRMSDACKITGSTKRAIEVRIRRLKSLEEDE